MAVRDDFSAGEVLAAADLNDTFASKWNVEIADSAPGTPAEGDAWVDTTGSSTIPKIYDGTAWQEFGVGNILQVVRATDGTQRATTSTSFTDVTGMSVTITPQKSTSAIVLIAAVSLTSTSTTSGSEVQISDSSNNAVSGAEVARLADDAVQAFQVLIGYATPATTSATTYKTRFRSTASGTTTINNSFNTGQMYAIEVSA